MNRSIVGVPIILAGLMSACGTTQASVSPSHSPLPTIAANHLFAVLESQKPTSMFGPDTVAIVGPDGKARAKATFQPLMIPYLPCLGPVLPTQAYVAAGKVFYIDGGGVVRTITPSGAVTTITRFPITSGQQEASFAVSPDGTHLLGAALTFPAKPAASAPPCSTGAGYFEEDIYTAVAGSSAAHVAHQAWNQTADFIEYLGWDAIGPFGAYPSGYGTQGGPAFRWPGPVVRVDTSGKPGQSLGSPECAVSDVSADGSYVCVSEGSLSVRQPDGSEAWHFDGGGACCLYGLLAPDKQHVAVLGPASCCGPNRPDIVGRDGSDVPVAKPFMQLGWLDNDWLIGNSMPQLPNADVAVVNRLHPTIVDDLRVKATDFVGVL